MHTGSLVDKQAAFLSGDGNLDYRNMFPERILETRTMKDVAYEHLKEAIVGGRLQPGQRLFENQLAEGMRISRTPLREALSKLEQEGLVRRLARGGAVVASVSQREATQLNALRAVLEGLAARQAALRVSTAEVSSTALIGLERTIKRMEDSLSRGDLVGNLDFGRRFHLQIWKMADNPPCTTMLGQVMDAMERYRHLIPTRRAGEVIEDHREIVKAIRAGDPEKAEQLMRTHVETAGSYYLQMIDGLELQKKR
jgi:DNA-binding GntR family transcriptional regulator